MRISDDIKMVGKYTPLNFIQIFEPRYHDQRVLINPAKVGVDNKIVFTRAASLPGTYYLSGKTIRKYGKESNGSIMCYCVPVSELQSLEINQRDLREVI